ncbi:MAG: hypothetical protein J6V47_01330, partial [Bacteroidaceae bacterium]|nr:hypothetical protein [Bacteroidaceae bacterium]
DDGSFSSPKECALAPGLAEGCCKATREQKEQTTDFVSAGAFRSFGRQKNMKERLEENTSEQLRLRTAVECNGERKRYRHRFLRPFLNILLSDFLIYMLIHTKFLLSL